MSGRIPGVGLYGKGMHEFVLREAEVGKRVAAAEDNEACGWSAIDDLQYLAWCKEQPDWPGVE